MIDFTKRSTLLAWLRMSEHSPQLSYNRQQLQHFVVYASGLRVLLYQSRPALRSVRCFARRQAFYSIKYSTSLDEEREFLLTEM